MTLAVCIVFIAIVAFVSHRAHRTLLSPWAVYLAAWLGLIGVHSLDWVHFNSISVDTWFLVFGSLAGYVAGAALVFAVTPKGVARFLPPVERWFTGVSFQRVRLFYAVTTIMGLTGATGYFLVVQQLYGLPTLLTDPGLIRSGQSGPEFINAFFWWKFPFYMNWLAIELGLAWILARGRNAPIWVWVTVALQVALNFALVSRAQMLLVGFIALFIVGSRRGHSRAARQLFALGLLMAALALYFTLAGERLGKTSHFLVESAGGFYGPELLRPLGGLYIYVAGNLPALQAFISEYAGTRTFGLFQILPLAKLLQAAGLITATLPNEVGEFLNVPLPFNTYTYLNVFYMDWGVVGVLIGPFLFGFLGNWFFVRTCTRRKVWHVIGSALIVYACLSSIGTSVLISTPEWEMVIALALLAVFARHRVARLARRTRPEQGKASTGLCKAVADT